MQRQISPDSACSIGESSRRKQLKVGGSFVHSNNTSYIQRESRWRTCLKSFLQSHYLVNSMAGIVLLDAFCTCADIDARAADKVPSPVVTSITDVCLGIYTLEALMQLGLFGPRVLRDWMTLMDMSIVLCGWAEAVIDLLGAGDSLVKLSIVRALRLVPWRTRDG
eukprot:Skav230929  [mRNA]  locus=scaffold2774:36838:41556:- [translate_table: standard]